MPIFFILYGWFTYISINRFLSQQSALTFFSALGQLVLYGLGCFFLGVYRERFQFARKAEKKLAEIKASNPIGGKSTACPPAGSLTDIPLEE